MVQKKERAPKSSLATWIGYAPVKFALYALFLPIILMMLYTIIVLAIAGNDAPAATWPMTIIGGVGVAIAVYKLIRALPRGPINRAGFVTLYTGGFLTVRLVGLMALFLFGLLYFPMMAAFMNPMHHPLYSLCMLVILLGLGFIGCYICGIQIAKLYATYLRAIDMGVSRTKALLSMPFSMFWMPGFFLESPTKKSGDSVLVRSRVWQTFVDWILASSGHTWLMLVLMVVIASTLYGWGWFSILALAPIIFILWMAIGGQKSVKKNINGSFAIVAIVVNVLTIVTFIATSVLTAQTISTATETIEITEQVAPGDAQ